MAGFSDLASEMEINGALLLQIFRIGEAQPAGEVVLHMGMFLNWRRVHNRPRIYRTEYIIPGMNNPMLYNEKYASAMLNQYQTMQVVPPSACRTNHSKSINSSRQVMRGICLEPS